ncbi:MAG: hypothetical protein ACFFD9_05695 [Candidatus Thorarchaeota archaeon]
MTRKRILNAVHEHDLEEFLESVGLLAELKSEQLKCMICAEFIKMDEIAKIIVHRGHISVICHKANCRGQEERPDDTGL